MKPRFNAGPTILLIGALIISGCASNASSRQPDPADPFEPVNRKIYAFNEFADKWVLRPVAKGYQTITPAVIRTGVNNFFDNLSYPVDILNALLQGKFAQAGSDTARFALNSTLGLGGILDPATDAGLPLHTEDLGQTMGVWGIPQGPYLIVPLFGPRTIRSGVGDLLGVYTNPQFLIFSSSVQTKVNIFWYVHARSTLLAVDKEIQRAFDRYAFVRDSYLQNREYLLYDGNPPEEEFLFEDEEFD